MRWTKTPIVNQAWYWTRCRAGMGAGLCWVDGVEANGDVRIGHGWEDKREGKYRQWNHANYVRGSEYAGPIPEPEESTPAPGDGEPK